MLSNPTFVHRLVILSIPVALAGSITYICNTLSAKTKPNRVSWLMWGIIPLLAAFAAVSAGANLWATFGIFLAGILPLTVFAVSFINPKAYWQLGKFDFLCGTFAILGLILWRTVGSPQLAILFLAAADGFASLPTIIKAWKNPETETGFTFACSLLRTILVLPSIPLWNIENSAFQIYLLISTSVIIFSIYRKNVGL